MTKPGTDADGVAARVADGEPVAWDDVLRQAPDERQRRLIRHLRLVESVARVHRSPVAAELAETTDGAPPPAAPPASARWAHLELREKLGEGAFGEVYRAWDPRLHREVALKLLRGVGTAAIEEGRLLAKLRHPGVVAVHGAEIHDGRVGFWMELIRGRSLEQLLREQGPFGAREGALIGLELCRALAAVHGAGVVHRDVKADNAMREEGGRIVLTDFGAGIESGPGEVPGTRTISGTPLYMAPEVLGGEPASRASDLYALGVLLFRLVTGSMPVEAATWAELRERHARRERKLLRDLRPDLPEAFVQVVERAIAPDPAARFSSAGQMEQSLAAALGVDRATAEPAGPPVTRRASRRALAGAGLLAAAVVAGIVLVRVLEKAPAGTSTSAAQGTFEVEAALYRVPSGAKTRERLEPGARLAIGDRLTLELRASAPLHVYVVNEDDAGRSYALFPLPGLEPRNPLAAGETHVLPGTRDGTSLSWKVDSAGGREHFLVLASRERLVEFEAELGALARPGQTAVPLPDEAKGMLRGIGGLAESPTPGTTPSAGRLFEMAQRLSAGSEIVRGVWMRQIELTNP